MVLLNESPEMSGKCPIYLNVRIQMSGKIEIF